MSNCPACIAWEADNRSGLFTTGCDDCTARDIARSPAAWAAQRGITAVGLQEAITRAWPEDYARGRKLVWDWMARVGARK
jgi:hypothetical protein